MRPVIPSPFLNELPLEEMRRVESAREQDWFDEDPYGSDDSFGDSYPESWDELDESDQRNKNQPGNGLTSNRKWNSRRNLTIIGGGLGETLPHRKQPKVATSISSSLKTAADLLSSRHAARHSAKA